MKSRPVWILAALLSAVALLVAPVTAQEEEKLTERDVEAAIKFAEEKVEEGDIATAGGWYLRIVTDYPERHDIHLRLARIYYELGNWGNAAKSFGIVAENLSGEDQIEAYSKWTDSLVKSRNYEQAVDAGRKAAELSPSSASVHINLAESLARTGSFQEAAEVARHALELEPTSAVAQTTLGEVQLVEGKVDEALASFEKALGQDPKNAQARLGMAEIHLKAKDWDSAITEATSALELNDALARAYAVRGLAYSGRGEHVAAKTDLAMAVSTDPDDPDTQYAYGQVQEAQDNKHGAATHYRKAYKLNPAFTDAALSLGRILLGQGDYQEAQQVLGQLIDREPDSARAHLLLGMTREKQDQPDAAIGELARAAELDPSLAAAHYWHGKVLLDKKQDVAGALPLLKKAAELEEENVNFLSEYGVALVNAQQFGEAVTVLSKVAADPEYRDPRGLYSLGAAHLNTQNFAEAIEPLQRAAEALPAWGAPHIGLAWATFAQIPKGCPCGPEDQERVQSLQEHYQKAVELGAEDPALKERVDILAKGEKIK
jgi:tetratricopeptide (TPR) repeat protein